MLDPLTALSLTGNVLQLVEFATNLLAKGREIRAAKDGLLSEHRRAQIYADQLTVMKDNLERRLMEAQGHDSLGLEPEEEQLRSICEHCKGIADQLVEKLNNIRAERSKNPFKNIRDALVASWSSKDVEDTVDQLQMYKQQLDSGIIMYLKSSIDFSRLEQRQGFEKLDQSTKDIIVAITQHDGKLSTQMDGLESRLSARFDEVIENVRAVSPTRPPSSPSNIGSLPGIKVTDDLHSKAILFSDEQIHDAAETGDIQTLREAVNSDSEAFNRRNHARNGQTPLHTATKKEGLRAVRFMLKNQAMVNIEDDHERLPLHYALEAGSASVARLLIASGAGPYIRDMYDRRTVDLAKQHPEIQWILEYGTDINVQNQLGQTALYFFVSRGESAVVRSLLDQHADLEIPDKQGLSPLMIAAKHNRLEMTDLLIEHNANVEKCTNDGTALVLAALYGHEAIITRLLEGGADIDAMDATQRNALHHCLTHRRQDAALLLIRHGARTDKIEPTTGLVAFHMAAAWGLERVLTELISKGHSDYPLVSLRKKTALLLASEQGSSSTVKVLLRHDPLLEERDITPELNRPLTIAADKGHASIVRLLCKAGAKVNNTRVAGRTALHMAATNNHVTCINILIEYGAEIDRINDLCNTPLIVAVWNKRRGAMLTLLEAGANPNIINKNGQSVLYHACVARVATEMIRDLLYFGADANQPETMQSQLYPIHFASMVGDIEIVIALIHDGNADVNSRTGEGLTPLMEAAKWNQTKIIQELLLYGADPQLRAHNGLTALGFAKTHGHEEPQRILTEFNNERGVIE